MHEDDVVTRIFREARAEVADAGFSRAVIKRIERERRRRGAFVLGSAVVGATIAGPALLRAAATLGQTLPIHLSISAGIAVLCAGVLALWLTFVGSES